MREGRRATGGEIQLLSSLFSSSESGSPVLSDRRERAHTEFPRQLDSPGVSCVLLVRLTLHYYLFALSLA